MNERERGERERTKREGEREREKESVRVRVSARDCTHVVTMLVFPYETGVESVIRSSSLHLGMLLVLEALASVAMQWCVCV